GDLDPTQLATAAENAKRAGVENAIVFREGAFEDATPPSPMPGTMVFNPPYGSRLGQNTELQALYEKMGPVLIERFAGWKAFILAGNLPLARHISLWATEKFRLNNGPIECRLLKFEPGKERSPVEPVVSAEAATVPPNEPTAPLEPTVTPEATATPEPSVLAEPTTPLDPPAL
ncbi:MAG: hypothetical protein JSS02_07135, partial [Planctomycetes bacterium]|nr:hypothetical protein [Planctomycetota bacterium]